MGVCSSSNATKASSPSAPGDNGDNDPEVDANIRKQGGSCNKNLYDMEDDAFEVEEATGEQFMAIRPWVGQIAEPANHNPINNDKPDVTYKLEYVYGYRSADSRQNVHYNCEGNACYMTAALGVILDPIENQQVFFGGGEVDNTSKQTANDNDGHTNDIMCIKVCNERKMAATGQVGSSPVIFTWDACTGEKKARAKLPKGSRGVNAIAFSKDGDLVGCVDLHNDHNVYVYNFSGGSLDLKKSMKGGQNKIHDIAFDKTSNRFVTVGSKHIEFYDADQADLDQHAGIYNKNKMTSFSCATWDDQGICWTGGSNSLVYGWGKNRKCIGTIAAHGKGFVCTINFVSGMLLSGGKDGDVHELDTAGMCSKRKWSFNNLIRAIDCKDGTLLVGLRNGTITQRPCGDGEGIDKEREIMHSHNEGEVWGLDMHENMVITSGDDNQVIFWSWKNRCKLGSTYVSKESKKAARGGASTLSNLPASQQSRSIAASGWLTTGVCVLAIGCNDGTVSIRSFEDYDDTGKVLCTISDSKEWIEVMSFSPCKSMLAVGSHDNCLYIYNTTDGTDWTLKGKMDKHSSYIMALDWSADSEWIRTNCGAYELLFTKISEDNVEMDPSGRSNTTEVEWATSTVKFGWNVEGIYPKGTDGTHINSVTGNIDGDLIACGDDYGLVTLFRDPARIGAKPRSYRGHSEHVTRVKFSERLLWSVGGYDQTLMQWTQVD